MQKQFAGSMMVIIAAIGFGLMGIFGKIAYAQGITVGTLLAYRFLIAAALFWIWIGFTRRAYTLSIKETFVLGFMGIGGYAVMATLLFSSFFYISASLAEMLFYTYPALVCILMRVFEKEPITGKKSIALLACFLGTLLVMGTSVSQTNLIGELFALGSALVYACFITYSNRLVKHITPLLSSAYITTAAGLALLGFAVVRGDFHWVSGGIGWGAVIGVAVCSTFIAILAFFEGVKQIGSLRASILSTLEPIVTL